MSTKTILVTAYHTQAEGVFSYEARESTVVDGKESFYHVNEYTYHKGDTAREIIFKIGEDLSWRASSDTVASYVKVNMPNVPFETPEIASDDVGNDMLEVALAEAFPEAYSKRNQKLENDAKVEAITKKDLAQLNKLLCSD